jgi:membrane-associated phospholipid phosphatase
MINLFDHFAMSLMSDWSQHSAIVNKFVIQFLDLYTVKALPVFLVIWLLWFSDPNAAKYRPAILEGFIGMLAAGVVSRVIQDCLPQRVRPLHSGDPYFAPPLGVTLDATEHWSSFPSDHAAVFFALSTALWLASKRVGAIFYGWSIFIVCLPRMFAGMHYASDIIAGASIGIVVATVIARPIAVKLAPWVWTAEKRSQALFYAGFFALSYQFTTMFDDVRRVGSALEKLL